MSITTLDTHQSNIYNKFMQLPQKTSFKTFHANFYKTNVYHCYRQSSIKYINKYMQLPKKSSFKFFQANFLKTNVYHYSLTLIYQIYTINSGNYLRKTSFMSFHANFLKTNVYFYYSDSSINISINSCNYHKRTSFKSFHPNF